MKGLTQRQREILDFVGQFIEKNQFSPSYREIQEHFGFASLGSIHKHLAALKRKGFLSSEARSSRSLALNEDAKKAVDTPLGIEIALMGQFTSAAGIETFSELKTVLVPEPMIQNKDSTYALKMKGDSLAEELVAHGDLLLVEVRQSVEPGETALCTLASGIHTVKRVFAEGHFVRLESGNPQVQPLTLPVDDLTIQAVLVGLLRAY